MYKIERKESGYFLKFAGSIDPKEMQNWYEDSLKHLNAEKSNSFGVIINMKDLMPLSIEASSIMKKGQALYKTNGMKRSAVILNSEKLCSQFKMIAVQSGIFTTEKYINAQQSPDYVEKAIAWVKDGIDPDKH